MYKKNTSTDRYTRAIASGLLFLSLLSGFPNGTKGQEMPEFEKPFKVCRTYPNSSGAAQIVASDNNKSIVFTNENNYLLSVNPDSKLENWKSQTGGKLYPQVISDNESIFFLSSFENETQDKTYILNSISQKTGITNWQKKLDNYSEIRLSESSDKEMIYLTAESRNVLAVRKEDGKINWTKKLETKIISITSPSNIEQVTVLTEASLIKLSSKTGELVFETKIKKNPTGNSIRSSSYLLLGYSNGEFIKISSEGKTNDIIWKIKAGGSISSVIELDNEVLISSFDNFLYLYSITSGKLKWKRRVSGRINLKPLIVKKHAIVLSSTDSIASIVELESGRIVNQIRIEDGNYFSDEPIVLGRFIIFPTFRGVYLFVNSDFECK